MSDSPAPAPLPAPPAPQRVVVTGTAGPALDTFAHRVAEVLDVPLVPLAELAGPEEVGRLAAFDGWVATGEYDASRAPLVERAQALVHLDVAEPASLTGLVKRTLRRVRAEAAPAPEQAWLSAVGLDHPELPVVRLSRPVDVEAWLRSVSA